MCKISTCLAVLQHDTLSFLPFFPPLFHRPRQWALIYCFAEEVRTMRAIALVSCCLLLLGASKPAAAIDGQGSQPPPAHYGDVIIDNRYSGSPGFAGTWNDPESGDIITSVIAPRQPVQPQGDGPVYAAPVISPGGEYTGDEHNRPGHWHDGPSGGRPGREHGRPDGPQYGPHGVGQPGWGNMAGPMPGDPAQTGPHWGRPQMPNPPPPPGQGQWAGPQFRPHGPQAGPQPPAMPRPVPPQPMPPRPMPGMGGR